MFKPVGSLINKIPQRAKVGDALVAIRVRQAAKDALDGFLKNYPTEVRGGVKIKTYKSGVLTINATPSVSAELHMSANRLIEEINYILKTKAVKALRFKAS